MTLHAVSKPQEQQLVWEAFPSWAHFTWLYLLSAVTALRGALLFRFDVGGWEMWIIGAGTLLVCAAILRYWAHYDLTRDHIAVRNYYIGRQIETIPLSDLGDVGVQQGVVADFFGIGTVLVHARSSDRLVALRGVSDPEEIKIRIKALAWRRNRMTSQPPTSS